MKVPLDKIKLDPNQPRKIVDEKSVKNLAKSLKTEGLIHPIEIDKTHTIIVGELRYRATKLLGWKKIEVNIYPHKLTPYERLRRQMAENLQQSGAKGGGQPMNPIDTAGAWAKLYKLRTGKSYSPGEHQLWGKGIKGVAGVFLTIAEEVGVPKSTVWEHLQLLEQPKYVIESMTREIKPVPRTFYREAERLPEKIGDTEIKKPIKKAIAKGKIERREDIIRLKRTLVAKPEKAEVEMIRIVGKQSTDANRILDRALELQIALKNATPEKWMLSDLKMVRGEMKSTSNAIKSFLGEIKLPRNKKLGK